MFLFPCFLPYWWENFPRSVPLSQLDVKAWEVIHHWKLISMTGLFPSNYGQRPCNSRQNSLTQSGRKMKKHPQLSKAKDFSVCVCVCVCTCMLCCVCVCVCVCVLLHPCTLEADKYNSTKNVCVAVSSNLATASSFHTVFFFTIMVSKACILITIYITTV